MFIARLEAHYGPWEKETSRFGDATFGKITKDLCMSASQFSKLIYGNGTEGMYLRSIRNIERLNEEEQLLAERDALRAKWAADREKVLRLESGRRRARVRTVFYALLMLLVGGAMAYLLSRPPAGSPPAELAFDQHPLLPYFDQQFGADYDSPYLKVSEVQAYCPCSGFEGKWSLSEPYKLPLPGSRRRGG